MVLSGIAHQLVIQYHMVSSENMHISNITQMEQVIFRNTYVFINTYMDTITMKKRPLILKRAMSVWGIEGRKEREKEIMQLY